MTRPIPATDTGSGATAFLTWMRSIGQWRSTALRVGLPIALWTALLCGGCGQSPQFSAKDQRLLGALRTAVSAHKTEWLDSSAKQIAAAHQKGTISDEGFEALQSAIAQARGDWKGAEKQIIQLEKAQRPPEK